MAVPCISVVIAARYPIVLCGLMTMLRSESGFSVVASCQDSVSCIEAIRDLSPNLALLDASLPGHSKLRILAAIKSEHSCTRVVSLSASSDASDMGLPIAGDACGVIPGDATPDLLVRCLRQVASELKPSPIPKLSDAHRGGPRHSLKSLSTTLTKRERQIMHVVCEGRSNKEVGRQLYLSEGTVKAHLHRIYQKLAIHNRTALIAYGL
jgi:two-component system, NarL family, nitrate/nitrite response regulator NarL